LIGVTGTRLGDKLHLQVEVFGSFEVTKSKVQHPMLFDEGFKQLASLDYYDEVRLLHLQVNTPLWLGL
jgi:hypothetical protein